MTIFSTTRSLCPRCLILILGLSGATTVSCDDVVDTAAGEIQLPEPYATEPAALRSEIIDWPDGMRPTVPKDFRVAPYATGLNNPRWSYFAPNGDLFVVESARSASDSADRVILLKDNDGDGKAEYKHVVIDQELNQPFGMAIVNDSFYIACTDALYRYPYSTGQETLDPSKQEKLLSLPAGGYNNHWTRNLLVSPDLQHIYISVGSASNVGEFGMDRERRRANILVVDTQGKNEQVYASGLRNPVGMDWNPITGELWTAVNERDMLGDELVPDYITSVSMGGFYGWPYSYYGQIEDPRLKGKNPSLVTTTKVPDVAVGAHTASLGLAFYDGNIFPSHYRNGAFIGQHGSWNRSSLSGYRVAFVPFDKQGSPVGRVEPFMTGFIANVKKGLVYGRPAGITIAPDGSLMVNDDEGGVIWRINYTK